MATIPANFFIVMHPVCPNRHIFSGHRQALSFKAYEHSRPRQTQNVFVPFTDDVWWDENAKRREYALLSKDVIDQKLYEAFENAIIGKNVGDKVTVNIPPAEAYGEIREDLLVKVPNTQLPGPVEVGQALQAQAENGMPVNVMVKEVHEDHAVIDGNHPFAGKELIFDIEVVSVQ